MCRWIRGLLVLSSLGVLVLVGCDQGGSEPVGGPGADVRTDDDQEPQQEEATFTASLEEEELEAPIGQQKELVISIERGEQFEETVTATIKAPDGLTVTPETIEYQAGQEEGKVFIEAAQGAEVGKEHSVEITFQPETGQAITKQLKVTVIEAEAGEQEQRETNQPDQTEGVAPPVEENPPENE